MPSSRGPSQPRAGTHTRTGRRVLYHKGHLGSPEEHFILCIIGMKERCQLNSLAVDCTTEPNLEGLNYGKETCNWELIKCDILCMFI